MNYRQETFKRKFTAAAELLSVRADQVVSLKLRENVGSHNDYQELVNWLRHEAGLRCSEVAGDLQGRGYILGLDSAKLLFVEHETGLEVLYIAASIASLLSLIPLVLQGWALIRGRLPGRHAPNDAHAEIRRIDQAGRLHEEHVHARQPSPSLLAMGTLAPAITMAGTLMENEMRNVARKTEELVHRIDALEKDVRRVQAALTPNSPKPTPVRSNSKRGTRNTGKRP